VQPVHAADVEVTYDALSQFGRDRVVASGIGLPGASVVVTAGVPFHESGTTNTMRLERL
jgi:pyruvate kinase